MKRELVALTLIVLVSSLLSLSLLSRDHLWGDDFAAYIMQARSILTGSEQDFVQHNAFSISQSSRRFAPAAYPWGFPLLLTPTYAAFGLNPLALKLTNVVHFTLFLIVFFFYLRIRLPWVPAAILLGVLAFNPSLLLAQDEILSDLPFLFFATLSIYLIDRYLWQRPRPPGLLGQIGIGFAIFFTYFVRIHGFVLIGVVFALNALRGGRSLRRIAQEIGQDTAIYATFALLFVLDRAVTPGGEATYWAQVGSFTMGGLLDNARYYILLPEAFFDMLPGRTLLFELIGLLFCIGVAHRFKRETPAVLFVIASLGLLMVYPIRAGLRYIYPLLPFFVSVAYTGGRKLLPSRRDIQGWYSALWSGLPVVSLIISIPFAGFLGGPRPPINGPFDELSTEMFSYIRTSTPADALIVFFKARAMRLFTDRNSIMLTECERLGEGNYIVINREIGEVNQVAPDRIENCNSQLRLRKVFQNRRFTVYEVQASAAGAVLRSNGSRPEQSTSFTAQSSRSCLDHIQSCDARSRPYFGRDSSRTRCHPG